MDTNENETSIWNSLSHFQLPEQPSSGFINRFIRLKTTYWNREYAIVLLSFIGLSISSTQMLLYFKFVMFLSQQHKVDHIFKYDYTSYGVNGFFIGLMPGGILATIYPAHNILGIFIAISSIGHLIEVMCISYLHAYTFCFLQFCTGITMAVVDASISRIWTYWVPLNKQSIRHVPIVLIVLIQGGGYFYGTVDILHDTHSSYLLTLSFGVIGLAWYVLWLYVINGNYSFRSLSRDFIFFGGSDNSRYSLRTSGVSLTRTIVSEIPWKSICTSKPVLAIALLHVCNARLSEIDGSEFYGNHAVFEWTLRQLTIILLLLFVVLVELVPEIIASISTSNVRIFWSCSYFGSVGIFFILEVILDISLSANRTCQYIFKVMQYLYYFGFYVNTLDIAPKYASLIDSLMLSIQYVFKLLWDNVANRIFSSGILNDTETNILMAVICLAAAVVYAIFATAELQPWAVDEEGQQNMVENDN